MDAGRCAGIFAERPTEWIAVSNPSAGNQRFLRLRVHVHVSTIMHYLCIVPVYMYTWCKCAYTRHLRTCRYAATHVKRTKGVKFTQNQYCVIYKNVTIHPFTFPCPRPAPPTPYPQMWHPTHGSHRCMRQAIWKCPIPNYLDVTGHWNLLYIDYTWFHSHLLNWIPKSYALRNVSYNGM